MPALGVRAFDRAASQIRLIANGASDVELLDLFQLIPPKTGAQTLPSNREAPLGLGGQDGRVGAPNSLCVFFLSAL